MYARKTPPPYGTEEWESFKNYAVHHYTQAIQISLRATQQTAKDLAGTIEPSYLFLKLLEKTASPLIYIWENWQILLVDQRLPFATPKYKKHLLQAKQQAKTLTQEQYKNAKA